MRKTIKVSDELWESFKAEAKTTGRDYHWVAEMLIENWVKKQAKKRESESLKKGKYD